jgi:hypothetical protein
LAAISFITTSWLLNNPKTNLDSKGHPTNQPKRLTNYIAGREVSRREHEDPEERNRYDEATRRKSVENYM